MATTRFAPLHRQVHDTVVENDSLNEVLEEGRVMMATYHAQLQLDTVNLLSHETELRESIAANTAQEQDLIAALTFIFSDCKRLSGANEAILRQNAELEIRLRRRRNELEHAQARHRGMERMTNAAVVKKEEASKALARARLQHSQMTAKNVAQHYAQWELDFAADQYREELKGLKRSARRSSRAAANSSGKGCSDGIARVPSTQGAPEAVDAGGPPEETGSTAESPTVSASPQRQHSATTTGVVEGGVVVCNRPDCRFQRERLDELKQKLRAAMTQLQDADRGRRRRQSSLFSMSLRDGE